MISLNFCRSHLSINSFPAIEIPDFTLITGPNGAGKSHLLQAIQQGAIQTNAAPVQNQMDVRLFDWTTMVPQDTGVFSSENIRQERHNFYMQFSGLKGQPGWLEPARSVVRRYELGPEFLSDPARVMGLPDVELAELVGDMQRAIDLKHQLSEQLEQFDVNIMNNLDESARMLLRAVSAKVGRPISSLTDKDILSPEIPTWGQTNIFQQNFGKLFIAYRDLKLANMLAEFNAAKGEAMAFLNEDQFLELHGPAPWDFVNASLSDAGLDFSINSPSLYDYTQFQPMLTKRSTGVPIPFQALSSGEKVLMSFAFCVYYSNDKRQIAVRPKILLFDEIDAPLHPSMSKNVINTIVNTLVEQFAIKVIATTHSPSTVALAPEGSIYTMLPGKPGLHKSSRAKALNILTVGVPTIAISYDGRRQVFVESPTDAKVYDSLYKLIKAEIASDCSLEFVATGTRVPGGGDVNTGCDNVKRIVETLALAGNMSVFGLLDWDGKNNPTERISVLAHGARNGIENVLFDPLLIALTICRSFSERQIEIGIPANTGFLELASYNQEQFQQVVTKVGEKVFRGSSTGTILSKYLGGLELTIDQRFATTDDHQLENVILTQFPFLRAVSKGQAGKLLEHIVSVVLTDVRFMPVEIKSVMIELLGRSAHS